MFRISYLVAATPYWVASFWKKNLPGSFDEFYLLNSICFLTCRHTFLDPWWQQQWLYIWLRMGLPSLTTHSATLLFSCLTARRVSTVWVRTLICSFKLHYIHLWNQTVKHDRMESWAHVSYRMHVTHIFLFFKLLANVLISAPPFNTSMLFYLVITDVLQGWIKV